MTATADRSAHGRPAAPPRTVETKSGRVVPVTGSMIASAQAQVSIAERLGRAVPELVKTIALMH